MKLIINKINMKKLLIFLFLPILGFSQDYSFSSATISEDLVASSLVVDNVVADNSSIGLSSDTDLLTLASGSLTIAGDIVTSSDVRLKSNIIPLGSTIASLLLIDGRKYTMNFDNAQNQKIGLLAQEVQEVFPELVVKDHQGFLSVNYQSFVPILINAVNEHTNKYSLLKNRINNLKSKIK